MNHFGEVSWHYFMSAPDCFFVALGLSADYECVDSEFGCTRAAFPF
jgi:hypothetical protein